jgi:cell division protein FtsI (penicillin-binding protein 3)
VNQESLRTTPTPLYTGRFIVVLLMCAFVVGVLIWRMVDLQVLRTDFLQGEGDARALRTIELPAHRGMITDRNGEPLAVSAPVSSVWCDPTETLRAKKRIGELADALGMKKSHLLRYLTDRASRRFVYLRRHLTPEAAQRVAALEVPGVNLQREYRRYYPSGEVSGQLVGFTDIDDHGQEGMELAYDEWLRGIPGKTQVLKDRIGRVVEDAPGRVEPQPGKDLALTIDRRLQYLAYRALKAAVAQHRAQSGSAVVLDARTGEILAMVNQPSFNPNNRKALKPALFRNRAVTDLFEPGSTLKPFTVAAGLESGLYRPGTLIDTHPGRYKVGRQWVRDVRDYGELDVTRVIAKSSNVGASKIALSLDPGFFYGLLSGVGFGWLPESGFPGEAIGDLPHYTHWSRFEQATLSFGYGLSTSVLQLARAYSVLAADGELRPVSLVKTDQPVAATRVLSADTARAVRAMMEHVVGPEGTGRRAAIPGYRVAGKTGTVRKSVAGGYAEDRHVAVFAGMVPASAPRLVMVVMLDEPAGDEYYGGQVAAPVFSRVMKAALRLFNVPPDDLPGVTALRTKPEGRA